MHPPDLSSTALWKQRFRAQRILWAQTAAAQPQRGLVCTNRSGVNQLYAWDVVTNELRQLTHSPSGKAQGRIAVDGGFVYYLDDQQGNEIGHHVRVPFTGGEVQDITPTLPLYASASFSENRAGTLLGLIAADSSGFQVYLLHPSGLDSFDPPRLLWRSPALCGGLTFSCDGAVVVVATTERSGTRAFNLIAWDTTSGDRIAEWYEEDTSLRPVCFSPQPSDLRLLVMSDRSGFSRPWLWDLGTGEQTALPLDGVQGELLVWDWSAAGDRLLLRELHQACYQLYIYDLAAQQLHLLHHPSGTLSSGQFLGDEEILLTLSNATKPPHLITLNPTTNETRSLLAVGTAPACTPWRSVSFLSSDGVEIQAWLALPDTADAPFPTIVHAHGGPSSVTTETFAPSAQVWLDHGFAWLSVNYRGSTTFGREFERSIWGRLGELEVEDLVAARRWLVEQGMAQADAILLTGGSYGGYLTLQTLGKYPDLWAGGMAEVAIADWFLMYVDQAETLRGAQRSLFGGTPQEKPEAHRAASPLTYAAQVKAPILVIQGRNDTRCPARQMQAYEAKLKELGKAIQVEWFDAGHLMGNNEQSIHHQELKLRFAQQVLQQPQSDSR
jgi:dienelactone hydrolase